MMQIIKLLFLEVTLSPTGGYLVHSSTLRAGHTVWQIAATGEGFCDSRQQHKLKIFQLSCIAFLT